MGIYQRGNIFWYGRMVAGQRVQMSWDTSDIGKAAGPFRSEIEAFIDYALQQYEHSAASADAKKYALKEFASFIEKTDPALITTADVERFYQQVRGRVAESTAQGYITTLRSFFNRL